MHVPDRHAEWRRQKGNHNSLPDAWSAPGSYGDDTPV